MKTCLAHHHEPLRLRVRPSSSSPTPTPGILCRQQYSQNTTMDPSSSSSSSSSSAGTSPRLLLPTGYGPTIILGHDSQLILLSSDEENHPNPSSLHAPLSHGGTSNQTSLSTPDVQLRVGYGTSPRLPPSVVIEDINLSVSDGDASGLHSNTSLMSGCHPSERPSSAESPSSARVRLMCSYGGRIMPRPGDGKLRYGGGETRMVAIDRGIQFAEFMLKMGQFYGSPLGFKYQLPDEDLDALVSVSSDDDMQNMMEEYEKVESSGVTTSRIRLFFFSSPAEVEVSPALALDAEDVSHTPEQRFVNAVNGVAAENLHLDDMAHQTLNDQPSKMASNARGFEGNLVEADISGGSSRVLYHEHYQFHPEQHNLERQMIGAADSLRVLHHDHLISRQGMPHLDSLSSITHQSPQIMDYRTSSHAPMDYRHDNTQHQSSEAHLSQIDHQRLIQKQQYIPQQHHHHYQAQYIPQQQQHTWKLQIDTGSGRAEHRTQDMHKQAQAFHNQHYNYPSHHHPHHVVVAHDKGSWNGEYHNHAPLTSLYPPHPQIPHGVIPAPPYQIDPPRGSIRDHQGRCPCGLQHALVHRGITVCIDEQSTASRWPGHIVGEQTLRKHGVFNSSRFSDNRSSFTDTSMWPHLIGTAESEHREQVSHTPGQYMHQRPHPMDYLAESHTRNFTLRTLDSQETAESEHREQVSHTLGQYMHQRPHPMDYLAESHSRNFTLRTLDSQETCQGTGGFDNVKHPGNKILGNPGYYDKQDHMVNEGFSHQKAFEVESGRVVRPFPNNQIPKDDDYRGEFTDEKCIDGQSILYRPCHLQGELESPSKRPGILHGWKPTPSGTRPLASEGIQSMQPLSTRGTESNPELTSLTTSVEMHDPWNSEQDVNPVPLRHMQVNKFREVESEIHEEGRENFIRRSVLMEASAHKSHEIVMASRKSVYDHGNLELQSDDKCEVAPDVSIHPLEVIDPASAATKSPALEGERCLGNSHLLETVTPHVKHKDIPLTSLSIDSLDGIPESPTYDKSIIRMTKFSFLESEFGSLSATEMDNIEKMTLASEVDDRISSVTIASLDRDHDSNKEPHHECGPENDITAELIESEKTQSSVIEKQESPADLELEERPDLGSSVVLSHQANDSQVEQPCKEETKEPEEEARARGLQIIKNADLEDLKELGSGTFGTVYHGKWRGSDVAIKRIKSSCFAGSPSQKERLISDFWKEACTLGQLHHPNVVAFYGIVPDGPDGTLATVTEYMVNGSLKQVLQKKDRTIDRRKRLVIAMDAAFGMEYLHSKNIVHFDLKCENLLVNMKDAHRPICKVGDFGLSKVKHQTLVSGGVRGTLPWMAPELLSGNSKMVTDKVDVYSFGIVMWELLTGEEPYASMQFGAIIRGIVDNTLRPSTPTWCDPGWRQLMEKCWSGNPEERPSFTEVALELRAIAASMNIK